MILSLLYEPQGRKLGKSNFAILPDLGLFGGVTKKNFLLEYLVIGVVGERLEAVSVAKHGV